MNRKLLANIFSLLPLAAGVAALCFAPELVPTGFDAAGEPAEWGSRWTLLLWPLPVLLIRLALIGLGKLVSLDKDGARLAAYMDAVSFAVTAFFALLALYKLAVPLLPGLDMSRAGRDARIMQFAAALLGILFIAAKDEVGAIPYNKNVGLKTKYTLAGEDAWRAAHVFLGRALAAAGGCTVVLAVFLPGVWSLAAAAAACVLAAVSAAAYARRKGQPPPLERSAK